jgi:hypothetical protein
VALLASCAALLVESAPASAYNEHSCGVYGTVIGAGERCPGIANRHSWAELTGYRSEAKTNMCIQVIRDYTGYQLIKRCSYYATSIFISRTDLQNGRYLTKAYNRNDNCCVSYRERRYLYATTE